MRCQHQSSRAAQKLPTVALLLGVLFLLQTQATCVPTDVNTGGAGAVAGGVTIVNQTGRELSGEELSQLMDNAGDGQFVVVFLNPTPGPAGPQGPPGQSATDTAKPMIGEIRMWAGGLNVPPAGWVLCDGRTLPAGDFPELFSVFGYRWGGDGAGNFSVPDFRNRSPMGADAEGQAGAPVTSVSGQPATFGGSAQHALTVVEMPAHQHDMSHSHAALAATTLTTRSANVTVGGSPQPYDERTGPAEPSITGSAGGGQPHPILDPYFAIGYIVYTGK